MGENLVFCRQCEFYLLCIDVDEESLACGEFLPSGSLNESEVNDCDE